MVVVAIVATIAIVARISLRAVLDAAVNCALYDT
jgi:hypothetical protein